MKIFGCPTHGYVDNGKLEPRSIKYVFLGYKSSVKLYKLWCPETKKVIVSRDIIFYETVMLHDSSFRDSCDKEQYKSSTQVEFEFGLGFILESTSQFSLEMKSGVATPSPPPAPPQYSIAKDKLRRDIKPPQRYAEADLVTYALNVAEGIDSNAEPSTYSKAVNCDDSSKWMIVM